MGSSAARAPRLPWFAVILAISLVVKALLLFGAIPLFAHEFAGTYGITFADDYDKLANSLATGSGYRFAPDLPPTLMREPGYPLFLAGVFVMLGYSLEAARAANFVLAFCICLLVLKLGARFSTDRLVPRMAALIFLFHPGTVIAEARGGVELLFILGLMLFVLALLEAVKRNTAAAYAGAGAVLGLVALVRSTLLLFPLLLLLYFVAVRDGVRRRGRVALNVAVLMTTALLALSPWIVRNYFLVGQFVPTASVQGVSAHSGQYICTHMGLDKRMQDVDADAAEARNRLARQWNYRFEPSYYQYFYSAADEMNFNRQLFEEVMSEYRAKPALLLKCATSNMFNFWFAGKSWTSTLLNIVVQLPLLCLAALGLASVWKRGNTKRDATVVALLVFYLWGVHTLVLAQARYSIPLVPLLSIFASVTLVAWWRRWQTRAPLVGAARGGRESKGFK